MPQMPDVIVIQYESPRCATCGRDLPRDRRRQCYICKPPQAKIHAPKIPPEESKKERYTIEDCAALAWAYGISYGQVVAILENHLPWPLKKRPLVWPAGSVHAGEK